MKLIFIDTETTGLPKNYKAPASDVENWPRVVEFAAIALTLGDINSRAEFEAVIKPEGFKIPKEASDVHGITQAKAMKIGQHGDVLQSLFDRMATADVIIGHNISFDLKVLSAEFIRRNISTKENRHSLCTMLSTQHLFGKWPKLSQLYERLTGQPMKAAHRAIADIRYTEECFYRLLSHGVINI